MSKKATKRKKTGFYKRRRKREAAGDYIDPYLNITTGKPRSLAEATFHFSTTETPKSDNTIIYIMIGVVVVSVIVGLFFFRKVVMHFIAGRQAKKIKAENARHNKKGSKAKSSAKSSNKKMSKDEKRKLRGAPSVSSSRLSGASSVSSATGSSMSMMMSSIGSSLSNANPSGIF